MKILLSLLATLIVLTLAIISVQNPALISLRFLGWQTTVLPLWVVIVAALTCGMVLSSLLTVPGRIQRARATRQLRHQLTEADTTIAALDQEPLAANARMAAQPPTATTVAPTSPQQDDFWETSPERELPGIVQQRSSAASKP